MTSTPRKLGETSYLTEQISGDGWLALSSHAQKLNVLVCGKDGAAKSWLLEDLRHNSTLLRGPGRPYVSAANAEFDPEGVGYALRSLAKAKFLILNEIADGDPDAGRLATMALESDVLIVPVDTDEGVALPAQICALCGSLGVRHLVLALSHADANDDFDAIAAEALELAKPFGFETTIATAIAAPVGVNSAYAGRTVSDWLERLDPRVELPVLPLRIAVTEQSIGASGITARILSGLVAIGDDVVLVRSGQVARVTGISTGDGETDSAEAGMSVTLSFSSAVSAVPGDVLANARLRPEHCDQFAARLVWTGADSLLPGRTYTLKIAGKSTAASVTSIKYRLETGGSGHEPARTLQKYEIAQCNLAASEAIAFDAVADNRATGAFRLADRETGETVGVGIIAFALRRATNIHVEDLIVEKSARAAAKRQKPLVIWFTGLSGSGKSTITKQLEKRLHDQGRHTYVLDGDNVRHGLNKDLGFTDADRVENIRRIGEVAKLFVDAGLIVMCSFISPFHRERQMVRELLGLGEFIEVFTDASLDECKRRDPKGLYAKVEAGKLQNFTGIDSPYEAPENPEIHIRSDATGPDEAVERIIDYLTAHAMI